MNVRYKISRSWPLIVLLFLSAIVTVSGFGFHTTEIEPPADQSLCILPKWNEIAENKTSSIPAYCHYIETHCDAEYFSLSRYYYCSKYAPSVPLLVAISASLIVVLTIILLSLTILVSNYLFKNLNELTIHLNINNHILGFILVPLTNTFPDLINYYVALDAGSSDLVIGQLVGSILILFTVVIGLISIFNSPFHVPHHRLMTIDFVWVLLVLVIFSYIMSDGRITLLECTAMIVTYIIYIAFLCFFDKDKLVEEEQVAEEDERRGLLTVPGIDHLHEPYNIEDALSILSSEDIGYGGITPPKSPCSARSMEEGLAEFENPEPVIRNDSYELSKIFVNIIDMTFFLIIPIHLTEHDQDELHWKHKANEYSALHFWFLIEIPILFNWQFFDFSWVVLIPFILVEISIIQMLLPIISPKLKGIFINIFGVANTLIVISNFSIKILQMLKNFGVLWQISDYLLGLIVFSISNSINDLITNLTISTKINPILGINACLGTPLLVILLGIGVNGALVILKHKHNAIRFNLTDNVVISTGALLAIVLFSLIYIPLNKWQFDKRGGIVLVLWYVFITAINCYLEM
ncbi:K+-dependent Na+:Ca2+ antiporter [Scheffersomyces xylosifermentans]|uniref:K+-dependent Na+:Ca2+ antiporter n=1 Tax=Scheffersomyces xylosifermentans TaxID=1304137 RepID=UPI00315C4CC8